MNNFYLARRNLKNAANLDLFCSILWALLFFIFCIYHFWYLDPSSYSVLSSSSSSSSFSSTYISTNGYSKFFNVTLIDLSAFRITLWTVVLTLFIFIVVSFILKVILGSFSAYFFFKFRDWRCLYSALAVIFFPLIGGVIATNTYFSKMSHLHPKYVASYSFLRNRIKAMWNSVILVKNEDKY